MARRRKSKTGKWLVTVALVAALGGGAYWWAASSNRPAPSISTGKAPAAAARSANPKKPTARVQETRSAASPARPVAPASMPVDRVKKTTVPRPAIPIGG
jgi:hypothetical protein